MAFLWIQKACGLDVRRNLHEVLVLFEKRNERRTTRTEDFGGVGFFLPHVHGVLVAFRKLRQLVIQGKQVSLLVLNRDAEAGEGFCRFVARRPRRLDLLVELRDERDDRHHVHARELERAVELRGFAC